MPEPLTVTEDQVRALRAALDALLPDERITQLTDERDRARRWAVGLEQENAELTRRLAKARAEALRKAITAVEDPEQRQATGSGAVSWESACGVLYRLLRVAEAGESR
ncbi:hypothetical protein [Streptomyces albidoflavus]|uniref:hypothetical protein n=1 Tax=Streptomyces albidoflavus TaxID=1886 RepID=UPI001021EAB0|nr:hypothetical protein [Streptomyces albidoflavus]RZF05980.1 hypothetical protein C0R05_24415 [Streptomyces albidoflavus]